MLNKVLLKRAEEIINTQKYTQFTIKARFINSSPQSTFSFYPLKIDRISINRDYASNFGDEIDLKFKISPHDYALMQDQGQDLICVLTMTYVDIRGYPVTKPKPVQRQYHVTIVNPIDVRSTVPDAGALTNPTLPITVRLIEKTIYEIRQKKVNTIFQNSSVDKVIYATASLFGIESVHLTPPDNKHIYDHVPILSYQSISSIYSYIQSSIGVYHKGINSYLVDGILYVYPAFDTDPTYDKTVKFYQVDQGRFSGLASYHKSDKNLTSIVVKDIPSVVDTSVAGSENVGTGFIFTKASKLLDGMTTLDSVSGPQFTEDNALTVTLKDIKSVISDVSNTIHIPPTDNPFRHMSKIVSQQASIMRMKWEGADPFIIEPPHRVEYMYDRNSVMYSRTGMVEKIKYEIIFTSKVGNYDMFSSAAEVFLRLSPNETQVI